MSVFDEARAVGEKMLADGYAYTGLINVYACTPPMIANSSIKSGCGYWIVTVDREPGVTPMFVKCGHCSGMATSRMYKVGHGLEPTHEWFRPAGAADLPEGYSEQNVADHLRNGGLLLRPIGDGKWLAPTAETRAFVAQEQAMIAGLSRQQRRYQNRTGRT